LSSGAPKGAVTAPFFEIGPKAYLFGSEILEVACRADRVGRKYGVDVIVTPQHVDIPLLACRLDHVRIFAQHVDPIERGRGVGSVLAEALLDAGAQGVLLNHTEKPLDPETLARTVARAAGVGLATMVCADTLEDALRIAKLSPDIIIAEAPSLIAGGQRGEEDRLAIAKINEAIAAVNPGILVLHGAGIHDARDVYDVIAAGAQGTGSSSGFALAPDPAAMAEEMIRAVREAWDATHLNRRIA
jgi:triosephosphate isomerase